MTSPAHDKRQTPVHWLLARLAGFIAHLVPLPGGYHAKGRGRGRRFVTALTITTVVTTALAVTAFAYWTSNGSGSSAAAASSLTAPSGLGHAPTTDTTVVLTWTAPVNFPSGGGYLVFRSASAFTSNTKLSKATAISAGGCASATTEASSSTTCTDTGLTPNHSYHYEVETAYGTHWVSVPSNQITVITFAANGSGTMEVTPSAVAASSTTTLTFTYTAGTGGTTNGTVTLKVPSGWTAPTTSATAGYSRSSKGTLSITSGTTRIITVTGLTLSSGATFTITYGATGLAATVTSTTGTATFTTKEASTSGPTPAALASQPTVNVDSLTTSLASTSITVGAKVHDTATLNGHTSTAAGSVTYSVYTTSSCSTLASTQISGQPAQVTVTSGTVPNSATVTFKTVGTGPYYWQASYTTSTGAKNASVKSTCSSESVTVHAATPSLGTTATTGVVVPGTVKDQAALSGGYTPSGTITFTLYGPSTTASCTTSDKVGTVTASSTGDNTYTSPTINVTTAGIYYWIAGYGGNSNNNSVTGLCGTSGEASTVNRATPSMITTAGSAVTVGSSVKDKATLSGGDAPSGTITFTLYGPSSSASCTTSDKVGTVTAASSGDGSFTSSTLTPTSAGTYYWIASYAGNTNNNVVTSLCGASGESVTVNKATPTFSTTASGSVTVGSAVHDTASISGGYGTLSGSVTFKAYHSTTTNCTGAAVFSTTGAISSGSATSGSWTTTTAGSYLWFASYTSTNDSVSKCGGSGETFTVNKATPTFSTTASGSVTVGSAVHDTASISGGYGTLSGSVTFKAYHSTTTNCTGAAVFSTTGAISSGSATSGSWTTTTAGSYLWFASYTSTNDSVSKCGGSGETFTVNKATPTFSTTASGSVTVGSAVHDTASISGGYGTLSGSVTFKAYHSTTTNCTGAAVFSTTGAISSGSATSGSWTTTTAGSYLWFANYTSTNDSVSKCGGSGETFTVNKATPTFTITKAPSMGTIGRKFTAATLTATLASGHTPTGTITLEVFGPSSSFPTSCASGTTWTGDTATVSGNGKYNPATGFTPTKSGKYWWYATYGGDTNNNTAASLCDSSSMKSTTVTGTFTCDSGTAQTFTLPAGVTYAFTLIGGGGGGGGKGTSSGTGGSGASGADITGHLDNTGASPVTLHVIVGCGGTGGTTTTANGTGEPGYAAGGNGGTGRKTRSTYSGGGGGGGGASSIEVGSTYVAIVGGGGGGGGAHGSTAGAGASTNTSTASLTTAEGGVAGDTASSTSHGGGGGAGGGAGTATTAALETHAGTGGYNYKHTSGTVTATGVGVTIDINTATTPGSSTSNGGAADTAGSSGSASFTPVAPHISLSPTSGPTGTTVTVSGGGFAPTSALAFTFTDSAGTTSASITPTVCTAKTNGTGTLPSGALTCEITVPTTIVTGQHTSTGAGTITVTDAYGDTATATFSVTASKITTCSATATTFKLPSGATDPFTLIGGGGGSGGKGSSSSSGGSGAPGVEIKGKLHNTSGRTVTLHVTVGCAGGTKASTTGIGHGTGGAGYASGGHGGTGHQTFSGESLHSSGGGGGGGGASALEVGSTYVAIVGGGGGGSGARYPSTSGTSGATGTTAQNTSTTAKTGANGSNSSHDGTGGGGGAGGGAGTTTTAAAVNVGGHVGYSYTHTTVSGVTVALTALTTGGNAGANGSAKFTDPPTTASTTARTPVQSAGDSTPTTSTARVTLPGTVAAGDALVLSVGLAPGSGAVMSVDGGGVTWHEAASSADAAIFYGFDSTGGSKTVTVKATSTITMANVSEWSGISHLDSTAHATGTGAAVSAGSLPVAGTHELVVSAGVIEEGTGGTTSITSPFAELDIAGPTLSYTAFLDSETKTSVTATWAQTSTDTWSAVAVAFNDTAPVTPTAPVVSSVSPATGPTAGGTSVIITGANFTATAKVAFGTTPATSVTVNGPTSIAAVSPAHTPGVVAVSVTSANRSSATSAGGVFTYTTGAPPATSPTVTSIAPATGPGSTVVTITGTGLSAVTSVEFGTVLGTAFTVSATGTTITVTAPTGTVGTTVTVSLQVGSETPIPAGKFTYTAPTGLLTSTPPKTPPAPTTPPHTGGPGGTGGPAET